MNAKYISLISTTIAFGYQYIIRVLPSVTMNNILEKFHDISTSSLGKFSGIFYIGYAAAHIPFGVMLDRIGLRVTFIISMLMAFIGLLPMIYSDSWDMLVFGRFISGFGSAGCTLSMIKTAGYYFPNSFSRILGITASFGLACAIFGGKPLILLIDSIGFEKVIYGIIILGALLTTLAFILEKAKSTETQSIQSSLMSVFTNYKLYSLCLFGGFMIGTLEGFADMWSVRLFIDNGVNLGNAALLSSMTFLGMGIGCPLLGYVSDKTKAHHMTSFISGMVMVLGIIMITFCTKNYYGISVIMIIIGIASGYQVPVVGKSATLATKGTLGLTTSYTNMILMAFGYLFHYLIGFIYEQTQSIVYGICIIPGLCLIGAIGFLILHLREKSLQKQNVK